MDQPHPPQAGRTPEPEGGRPKGRHGVLFTWARDLALSVLLAMVVILFLYQPVKVEGTSMMPALADQERIFINKFVYRLGLGEVRRGDLVVFWFSAEPERSYIKRVIGLPGDVVEIRSGTVVVNGGTLAEEYVPEEYRDQHTRAPMKIPIEHYYVLGDHRSSSNDSRSWGPVHKSQIYGKAVFVYWPLEKIGPLP